MAKSSYSSAISSSPVLAFLRTPPVPTDVKTRCYELNIADAGTNPFPTGSFVERKAVDGKYGGSDWQPQGYWFADYVADLDALVDEYAPGEPVDIAGHSLGGNVTMTYAGVRPARVRRAISLDGFGIPAGSDDDSPRKFEAWLDALRDPPRFAPYADLGAVADRLQKNNPRLSRERAEFLARWWARVRSR